MRRMVRLARNGHRGFQHAENPTTAKIDGGGISIDECTRQDVTIRIFLERHNVRGIGEERSNSEDSVTSTNP